jgi:hypothetical protein
MNWLDRLIYRLTHPGLKTWTEESVHVMLDHVRDLTAEVEQLKAEKAQARAWPGSYHVQDVLDERDRLLAEQSALEATVERLQSEVKTCRAKLLRDASFDRDIACAAEKRSRTNEEIITREREASQKLVALLADAQARLAAAHNFDAEQAQNISTTLNRLTKQANSSERYRHRAESAEASLAQLRLQLNDAHAVVWRRGELLLMASKLRYLSNRDAGLLLDEINAELSASEQAKKGT